MPTESATGSLNIHISILCAQASTVYAVVQADTEADLTLCLELDVGNSAGAGALEGTALTAKTNGAGAEGSGYVRYNGQEYSAPIVVTMDSTGQDGNPTG